MALSIPQVPTSSLPGLSAEDKPTGLLEQEEGQEMTAQLPFVGGPRPTMTKLKENGIEADFAPHPCPAWTLPWDSLPGAINPTEGESQITASNHCGSSLCFPHFPFALLKLPLYFKLFGIFCLSFVLMFFFPCSLRPPYSPSFFKTSSSQHFYLLLFICMHLHHSLLPPSFTLLLGQSKNKYY